MSKQDKKMLNEASLVYLRDALLSLPRAKRSISGSEISFRCPFCGDSKSDPYATSFSVNVDPESEKFGQYQCFRANCQTHGIINSEFMYMIGFNNYEAEKDISKFIGGKSIKVDGVYKTRHKNELCNVINTYDEVSEVKRKYINKRLGLNLSYEDLYRFKINLDLLDLLKINDIDIPNKSMQYYRNLSDYGISFISAYNDYAIIRDISKSGKLKKRYTNISIFGSDKSISKAYCIPTEFDLMCPEPTVINISEGAFDILGVYHHIKIDKKYNNKLYLAACGSGIVNTLFSYIQEYGIINCKINIFADSDVSIDKFNKVKKLEPYLMKYDVNVFYNTMSKDFGVPKNQIKYIKSKL